VLLALGLGYSFRENVRRDIAVTANLTGMTQMLQIMCLLSLGLLIGWLIAESKAKCAIRVGIGAAVFTCVGYAGFLSGKLQAAADWAWVFKEHGIAGGSMQRIEELLARGETSQVRRAITAYNETIKSSTNEFGYYRASSAMWDVLKEGK
jgi:hypothetical protein